MVSIHHQPIDGSFGTLLNKMLKSNYSEFTFVSAFAKEAGVLALESNMRHFRENGGRIQCYIGIDMDATSYDALHRLLNCTDELYVCHDRRKDRIFHPKEYLFENTDEAWLAIGSNNLTYTGLNTNVEGAMISELDLKNPNEAKIVCDFKEYLSSLKSSNACLKIDESTLDILLMNKMIAKEIDIIRSKPERTTPQHPKTIIFGQFDFDKMPSSQQMNYGEVEEKEESNGRSLGISEAELEPRPTSEFWIETGKMTGGSRNILDLSKTGSIEKDVSGDASFSVEGKPNTALGSVTLFGVNPGRTSIEKDITINLNGVDYYGNTIKIETAGKKPNLSWRLQLKGESKDGAKLTEYSFVEKILLFQKVSDSRFIMRILDESEMEQLIKASCIVAKNGIAKNARKYGIMSEINDSD